MSYSFRFYKLQGSCIRRKFDLILLTSLFFFFSSLLRDIFHPPLTCLVFWRGERRKIVQLSSSYVRVDVSVPSVCWWCRWQTGVRSSSSQGSWLLDLWLSLLRCQRANPQVLGDWIWLFLSFILWVCAFSWLILSSPPQNPGGCAVWLCSRADSRAGAWGGSGPQLGHFAAFLIPSYRIRGNPTGSGLLVAGGSSRLSLQPIHWVCCPKGSINWGRFLLLLQQENNPFPP